MATIYELRPLFRSEKCDEPVTEVSLTADPNQYIEGEVGNVVFASVPPATSAHACDRLDDILRVATGDKKVVVILTHNIELLAAKKLSSVKAAKVVKRVESPDESEEVARKEALYAHIRTATSGWTPEVFTSKPQTEVVAWAVDFMRTLQRTVSTEADDGDSGD